MQSLKRNNETIQRIRSRSSTTVFRSTLKSCSHWCAESGWVEGMGTENPLSFNSERRHLTKEVECKYCYSYGAVEWGAGLGPHLFFTTLQRSPRVHLPVTLDALYLELRVCFPIFTTRAAAGIYPSISVMNHGDSSGLLKMTCGKNYIGFINSYTKLHNFFLQRGRKEKKKIKRNESCVKRFMPPVCLKS